jgi:hypothetical protein
MRDGVGNPVTLVAGTRGEAMREPDEVAAMDQARQDLGRRRRAFAGRCSVHAPLCPVWPDATTAPERRI